MILRNKEEFQINVTGIISRGGQRVRAFSQAQLQSDVMMNDIVIFRQLRKDMGNNH